MSKKYKAFTLRNYREISGINTLGRERMFDIEVVAQVFPFKTNNYFVEELVNWDDPAGDPMFRLNFPQREMLLPHHFDQIASLLMRGAEKAEVRQAANRIRYELNPHPAGQMEKNVPTLNGRQLQGIQHKYRETVLFFPSQGQTCHSYCTFCFRWPQFIGISGLRFATEHIDSLVAYIKVHPEVTDVLITGGDPMVMSGRMLAFYVDRILDARIPHLRTIRFGTKALSYWPYRFLTDEDSGTILDTIRKIRSRGLHAAIMAHFNHPAELSTDAVRGAIERLQDAGAEIRTQSPLLRHINDEPRVWSRLWAEQVKLSAIPYYMFVVRDTGAQHYFGLPLVRAWDIFREAYQNVSGVARTVRGPSMSADPGKVRVVGVTEIDGREVIALQMLQGRNPEWVLWPFFAEYDEGAMWLDDLIPAFNGPKFFFEEEDALVGNRRYIG